MQCPAPRIQDGCFSITGLNQTAKPITCLRVPLMRPILLLVPRVGWVAGRMRRRLNGWAGYGLSPTAGRSTTARLGQILPLQPLIFTDQSATRLVLFAGPIRAEKLATHAVQCFADRAIAPRNHRNEVNAPIRGAEWPIGRAWGLSSMTWIMTPMY